MTLSCRDAVMLCDVITSYVAKEKSLGVPLGEITILRSLPGFMNSAQRALKDLVALMPDNQNILDAEAVLKATIDGRTDEESN